MNEIRTSLKPPNVASPSHGIEMNDGSRIRFLPQKIHIALSERDTDSIEAGETSRSDSYRRSGF